MLKSGESTPPRTLASVCATVAATVLTLLLLDVDFNTSNVIAVANPLEKMLTFADASTANAANGSSRVAVVLLLMEGFAWVLARYTFVLHSSPRPTIF